MAAYACLRHPYIDLDHKVTLAFTQVFTVCSMLCYNIPMQLCSTEAGRSYLHEKQVYVILRALEMWDREETVRQCCLNLISILISDEPEPEMRDLDRVKIPPDISQQLNREIGTSHNSSQNGSTR